jgi:large subunit ribosomal protein L9
MQVILRERLDNLGNAGEVVDVKPGYARNYLIPRGFAIAWTKGGEKDVEQIRRARRIREIHSLDDANAVKAQLQSVKVKLSTRAGDTGRLFGSITPADIATAIKDAGGPAVDKRRIEVAAPIKTLGAHRVSVRLHPEVEALHDQEGGAA